MEPAGDTDEPDHAWLRAVAELAPPPLDLASDEPDWRRYAMAFVGLCQLASPASRAALQTTKLPHMRELRRADGDQFRRCTEALAGRW